MKDVRFYLVCRLCGHKFDPRTSSDHQLYCDWCVLDMKVSK